MRGRWESGVPYFYRVVYKDFRESGFWGFKPQEPSKSDKLNVHKATVQIIITQDFYLDCDSEEEGRQLIDEKYLDRFLSRSDYVDADAKVSMKIKKIKKLNEAEEKEFYYDHKELEFERFYEEPEEEE